MYGKIRVMDQKKNSGNGACGWKRLPISENGWPSFTSGLGNTFAQKPGIPMNTV
jgi:hypothetical protein